VIKGKKALSTTLLEGINGNGYAENLQTKRFHAFL
jgi:hypothetical protein